MADASMVVGFGADVSNFETGIQKAKTRLRETSEALDRFSKKIQETSSKASSIVQPLEKVSASSKKVADNVSSASVALAKVPNSSNQATQAMMNLSRVAQDAPYGFIGIANNINPLLESFQRLKASTGTTGSALKAMAAQLTGPAGIGLAVGVVSSLLVTFGSRLFGASRAAKEATEENEKLAESISGDIVKLTSLVAIIQNVNSVQSDRVKALKAINQEYGKYLGNLNIEKVTVDNLKTAYDGIIDSLIKKAVVKGLQEEIEKRVKKTAAAIIALEKSYKETDPDLNNLNNTQEENTKILSDQAVKTDKLSESMKRYNNTVRDGYLANQKNLQVRNAQVKAENNYEKALKRLQGQLMKDLKPLFEIFGRFSFQDLSIELKPPPKDKKDKPDEKVKIKMLPDFGEYYGALNILKKETLKISTDKAIQKGMTKSMTDLIKKTSDGVEQVRKEIQDKINVIAGYVGNALAPAFDAFFNAMSEGENAIAAFGNAVTQAIKKMIAQLAAMAAVAGILSALGLGSFASLFKSLSGINISGKAAGGPVMGNTPYIIGEKGPELFVPSTSGRIVPNHQLGGIQGSASQMIAVTVGGVISGRNIALVLERENRYQMRGV